MASQGKGGGGDLFEKRAYPVNALTPKLQVSMSVMADSTPTEAPRSLPPKAAPSAAASAARLYPEFRSASASPADALV